MVQFHVLGEMVDSLLHAGVLQGVPGTLVPYCMGSCLGQILIETATHSYSREYIHPALYKTCISDDIAS